MKPKSALTLLLALALSGGLLWAFPTLWMALILALLGLLATQATLVRRSLSVVRADLRAPSLRVSRTPEGPVAAPAFANQSGTPAKPALDPAAFARFRSQLEAAEQQRGLKPSPENKPSPAPGGQGAPSAKPVRSAGPADSTAREIDAISDQVAISAKAGAPATPAVPTPKVRTTPTYGPQRRVVMPGQKAVPPPKIAAAAPPPASGEAPAEEPEVDLFDDLRPNRQGTLPAKAALPPDAVADAIRAAPEAARAGEESAALLKLAEDAFRRGETAAARAALDQHLSLAGANKAAWQAHRLAVRISAVTGEPQLTLDAFDAMLKAGFALKEDGTAALVDELLQGAPADLADGLRVSLLLKVLGVFRQAANRAAMDQIYRLVIEAQERVGDERKLVQFLKNHFEIKKAMGEVADQLEIIDEIGNRLFKLGQTAEAREYYELGLKLRADAQADPAAPQTSKTTRTA